MSRVGVRRVGACCGPAGITTPAKKERSGGAAGIQKEIEETPAVRKRCFFLSPRSRKRRKKRSKKVKDDLVNRTRNISCTITGAKQGWEVVLRGEGGRV